MKTATKVKDLENFRGKATLYKLSEPLEFYEYIVASAIEPLNEDVETYLFGCNPNGEIFNWIELSGSTRGVYNHETALNNAGYEVK